jgi:hypothetical protein
MQHWSYSSWAQGKKCPLSLKFKYIDRLETPPFYAMERGTQIHALAENVLNGKISGVPKPLLPLRKELLGLKKEEPVCEKFWGVDDRFRKFKGYGAWLVARTDAFVKPTRKRNILIIVDQKTGKIYDSHVDQATLYAAVGFALYPDVEGIEVEFFYFDQQTVHHYDFTRFELQAWVEYWTEEGHRHMSEHRFLATPSEDACRWCDFRSDKKLKNGRKGPCHEWKALKGL